VTSAPCTLAVAAIGLFVAAACARPMQEWDVMSMPAVCDSVPRPVRPGEPLGATLPTGERASADSGTVVGMVTEAGTGRTMHGATAALLVSQSSDSSWQTVRRVATTSTGGFAIRSVVPGQFRLRVTRIGQRPHEQPLDVRAGAIDTVVVALGALRCSSY
jgi:hypothetical protein